EDGWVNPASLKLRMALPWFKGVSKLGIENWLRKPRTIRENLRQLRT
ncbi:7518_t:CDS:1, partial [Acaulospora morrowiae]